MNFTGCVLIWSEVVFPFKISYVTKYSYMFMQEFLEDIYH